MQVGSISSGAHPLAYDVSNRPVQPGADPKPIEDTFTPSFELQQRGGEAESPDVKEVEKLERREEEVKTHEAAHKAAAGSYARGGPRYEFTNGPDGKRYITGGEVSLDVSKESTPEKTIAKAKTIRAAALAPANPSSADRAIASKADAMATQARAELAAEATEKREEAKAALKKAESEADGAKGGTPTESKGTAEQTGETFETLLSKSRLAAAKRAYSEESREQQTTLSRVA